MSGEHPSGEYPPHRGDIANRLSVEWITSTAAGVPSLKQISSLVQVPAAQADLVLIAIVVEFY